MNYQNSQQLTIQQAISRAKKATQKGKIADAVELYNAVLQQQPNHPIAKKALRKLQKDLPQNQPVETETSNPSQDQISTVANLYHSSQMIKTEQACRELLKTSPHSLDVINLLGAALQRQGRLQEAMNSYNKAIQLKPDFAEAYNNRGQVLKELGELDEAVKNYEKALKINPNFAEAHNNVGNTLKELGQLSAVVTSYERALAINPDLAQAHSDLGSTFHVLGQLDAAVKCYDKALKINPKHAPTHSNKGVALKQLGQFDEALQSYDKAIQFDPDYAEPHNNKGLVLKQLDQLDEALQSYDKAIQLKPAYAEAHNNLGNLQYKLGLFDEAAMSYSKAIQLKPDYADAYVNQGTALRQLGQLDEAIVSLDKAIQLKPVSAEAYHNRGKALQDLGLFVAAMASHQKAVSINPSNGLFWESFAEVLRVVKFTSYSDDLGYYLLQVLEQPTVRSKDVSKAVIEALHYHPTISRTLELSKSGNFDEDIDHLTEQLSTVPLLLRVMELSTIADLDVEKMLTKMRKAMLHKAASGGSESQGIPFSASLAMHCFTNEYVFSESEEEKQELELFQKEVEVILTKEGIAPPAWIAVLGAYRPLYSFSWANDLLKTDWPDEIKKVIVGQVDNVREEQTLRSKIQCLSSIDDKISQLVRNQYEENPYPRWVNTGLSDNPKTTRQILQSVNPHLNFEAQKFSNKPDILVAGCGTGQHALVTASHFLNCNVLAVDLSLSSLSYGIRKTQELGVTNIEYMQGDILKLDQLKREFDIIECVGALHHMDDPLAGWKVLVDKLRVDGVMKIGLYSEIARQDIANCRREIAEKEYTSSPDDIRRYREELINKDLNTDSKTSKLIIGTENFYSLSGCRDLLFHAQEHHFTLPQIEAALKDLGLKFLGFEIIEVSTMRSFSKLYSDKDALVSLPLWHQFELKNPGIFRGMYQFWVQKA